jgi:macrolide transport system ATP-binding/permease protein
MSNLLNAFRTLRRSPGFAAATIVTLALAIGANTAMFSFGDATAFRPPDVPRAGEIVRVFSTTKEQPYGRHSVADYLDYRDRTTTLAGTVAHGNIVAAMSERRGEIPRLFWAWAVSGNFFSVLEVQPGIGRGFAAEDDKPGAKPVAVLSHSLWRRHFNSDPAVVGSPMILGQREFTIVGVAPERFAGTDLFFHPDLYVPLSMSREVLPSISGDILTNRSNRWLTVLGRLKPNADISLTNAEIVSLARALEHAYPETNKARTAQVLHEVSARGKLDTIGYQAAAVALGIVGLVLLIACANVANLMLSRTAGRAREFAVRLAIGASRGQLVRQLLTESLLLASAGALLGILIAHAGIQFLSRALAASFAMTDMPISVDARIDTRVLLFTLVVSAATSLLFGLAPALQSSRLNLVPALKASVMVARRRRWFTQRHALVTCEITLAVVVLTVAGMSIRGFVAKQHADPGFRTDGVLLMSFNPGLVNYSEDQTRRFYKGAVDRAKTLPGVVSVGLAEFIPLGFNGGASPVVIDGYEMPAGQNRLLIGRNIVDDGYWHVMRTPIVRGRLFDDRDTSSSPAVVIVNETMARRYWPNQDAIGKIVRLRDRSGPALEIVGIVKDGKYTFLGEPPQPFMFMPASQQFRSTMTMVVLGAGEPSTLAAPIRAQLKELDSHVPMFDVRTYGDLFQSRALLFSRLTTQIFTWLGFLAMILAAVGLYSVIAYLTALRTREIGIRTAVGADRRTILLLIGRQAIPMIAPGLVAGGVLAYFAMRFFAGPFDFATDDPAMLTAVVILFAGIALVATLIPARRAARVDPLVALRYE